MRQQWEVFSGDEPSTVPSSKPEAVEADALETMRWVLWLEIEDGTWIWMRAAIWLARHSTLCLRRTTGMAALAAGTAGRPTGSACGQSA